MPSVPPPQAATEAPAPAPVGAHDAPDELPWPLWVAPAAIVLGLALGQVAVIIVEVIGQSAGSSFAHPTPAVVIVSDVVFDLAFVAAALYFAAARGHPQAAQFGLRRTGLRLGVGAFVLAGIGYYTVSAAYAALFQLHGQDKLPSELGVDRSHAALAAAAVFVCVIAPVAEEFFFRGFFFGVLRRWRIMVLGRNIGTWVAAIVTGILFGLAHTGSASSQYLIPLGFLGFVLCLVRWRTRSLYPCMALHSFNNSLALGVSQLHWAAGAVIALVVGSWLVIAALMAPFWARPEPAAA
jgi:membrane protease YdiL (CAAX protease family)